MATQAKIVCKYCGKSSFKSQRGLQQHVVSAARCLQLSQSAMKLPPQPRAALGNVVNRQVQQVQRSTKSRRLESAQVARVPDTGPITPNPRQMPEEIIAEDFRAHSQSPEIMMQLDDNSSASSLSSTPPQYSVPKGCHVSTVALKKFLDYRAHMQQQYHPFSKHEVASIKLIDLLRRKKATLDTYDAVLEWHLRENGAILPQQKLGDYYHYISRKRMLKKLANRYLGTEQLFYIKTTKLPVSGTKVDLIFHNARDLVVSLLTDPRFSDEDFQHFGNNPLAAPPKQTNVGDTSTGRAYRKTYEKLITDPTKQMLVPIQMYIDGAVSGQFGKLNVEALKMTLGIFNAEARNKRYAWRTLGYVPNYHRSTTRGKQKYAETGHIAATSLELSDDEFEVEPGDLDSDDGEADDDQSQKSENFVENPDNIDYDDDAHENQDWHHILAHLLMTYKELEKDGMLWHYKYGGKVYENIELVFFIHFVKCDGDEADKLCGKYTTRTGMVKNLCRFCECPTGKSSWVFGDQFPKKTEARIKALVDKNDLEGLRNISQRFLINAFHGMRFGLHNGAGIHGACPMEMLHHILLGIFKYVTNGFKEHIGLASMWLDEINALAKQYGALFARNSDRDLPKTTFSKGIMHGKIMGKEYSGVMLILAAILQSNLGRTMLKKMTHFKKDQWINDWAMLVETMLQWEAFLKLPEMQKKHVNKLKDKHRVVMYLIKSVLRRKKGMGMDTMKFHGILHLCDSIMNDGVPNVVDSGSNESHHKPTKYYSTLTQKNEKTFEKQTAQREDEFALVDIGLCELEGKFIWDYLDPEPVPDLAPTNDQLALSDNDSATEATGIMTEATDIATENYTGGTQLRVWSDHLGQIRWEFPRDKAKDIAWDIQVLDYLGEVQNRLQEHVGELNIRTEHKRKGKIFRGHPNFKGTGQWNDWVLVDWANGWGKLPAEIWCFLDLSTLPEGVSVKLDGQKVQQGVYAVVESSEYVTEADDPKPVTPITSRKRKKSSGPNEEELREPSTLGSDMFTPFRKEMVPNKAETALRRRFYLADVESFADPICVIPDIGMADDRRYFHVKARTEWANDFIKWLETPDEETMAQIMEEEGTKEYLCEVDRRPKPKSKKPKTGNGKGKQSKG